MKEKASNYFKAQEDQIIAKLWGSQSKTFFGVRRTPEKGIKITDYFVGWIAPAKRYSRRVHGDAVVNIAQDFQMLGIPSP